MAKQLFRNLMPRTRTGDTDASSTHAHITDVPNPYHKNTVSFKKDEGDILAEEAEPIRKSPITQTSDAPSSSDDDISTQVMPTDASKAMRLSLLSDIVGYKPMHESMEQIRDMWTRILNTPKFTDQNASLLNAHIYWELNTVATKCFENKFNDYALSNVDAAITLLPDHWHAHSLKADILSASGKYEKANKELSIVRKCLMTGGKDTPESLMIYYGGKIDGMVASGNVSAIAKKIDKAESRILKASTKKRAFVYDEDNPKPQYDTVFKDVKKEIGNDNHNPSKKASKSIKRKSTTEAVKHTLKDAVVALKTGLINSEIKKLHQLEDKLLKVESKVDIAEHMAKDALHEAQSKASRADVSEAMRDNPRLIKEREQMAEIEHDPKLLEYYNAFRNMFSITYNSAQTIKAGQVALNTGGLLESGVSMALGCIPFCGDALSKVFDKAAELYNIREITKNAILFLRIAATDGDIDMLIKQIAREATLSGNKKEEILAEKKAPEIKGLFNKLKAAYTKIKGTIDKTLDGGELYQTDAAQLAIEDVIKMIGIFLKVAEHREGSSFFTIEEVIKILIPNIVITTTDRDTHIHASMHTSNADFTIDTRAHTHQEHVDFVTPHPLRLIGDHEHYETEV